MYLIPRIVIFVSRQIPAVVSVVGCVCREVSIQVCVGACVHAFIFFEYASISLHVNDGHAFVRVCMCVRSCVRACVHSCARALVRLRLHV